jgi:hypothetical protein
MHVFVCLFLAAGWRIDVQGTDYIYLRGLVDNAYSTTRCSLIAGCP